MLLFWLICLVWWGLAVRQAALLGLMPHLSRWLIDQDRPSVLVSILIPARDEAITLRAALERLLEDAVVDASFEVILVDDHSTDGTGLIADGLAERFSCLRVLHLNEEVPGNWSGKSYACYRAYLASHGEYLLFCDADTLFAPGALAAVARYAVAQRPDHLLVYPRMLFKNTLEAAFQALFAFLFVLRFDPFGAALRGVDIYTGIGAFALVRRDVYERLGTHQALALTAADDLQLGRLVKAVGGTTDVLCGDGLVEIAWRNGFVDTLRGAWRALFPSMNYSWWWLLAGCIGAVGGLLAPWWMFFVEWARWPALLSMLAIGAVYGLQARLFGTRWLIAWLFHPLMTVCFVVVYVGSALSMSIQGGVRWRGRFIPLDQLRRSRTTFSVDS